ncbi:uncharacterized protein LOC130647766 isoform X2 [Hydractinia symbiolongicarpus]|nr:uncharacterized protein LOC130647766 isoform X2 [Hydractinia symbiolongicarpus]
MFYSQLSTQPQDHSTVGTGLLTSQSYDEQMETILIQSTFEQETLQRDLTSLPSTEITETESTPTISTLSLVVDTDFSSASLPMFKEISPFSSIKSTTSIMQYGSQPTSLSSCIEENYTNSILTLSAKGSAHYSIVTGYHSDSAVSSRTGFLASKTKDSSLISEKSLDYKSSGRATPSLTRLPVKTSSMLVQNTKSTVTLSTMEEQPMIADTAQKNYPSLVQTLQYMFSQNMIDVETSSSRYKNNVATKSFTSYDDATFSTQKVLFSQNKIDAETSSSRYENNVATESVTSYDDATLSTQKVLFSQNKIDAETSSSRYENNVATKSFTSYDEATFSTQKVLFSQNMIDVEMSSSRNENNVATESVTSYDDATLSTQKVLFSQNMIEVETSISRYGSNVATKSVTSYDDATLSTQKVLLSQNMIDVETSSSQYGSNVATKSVTSCDDATLSTQKVLFSQNMIDVETSSSQYGSNVATKSVTSYDDATLSTQKVLFSQIMIDVLTSSSQYGNNVATKSFTSYNDATLSTQKVLFSQNMIDVKSSSSWYGNNVATKSFTSYNDATLSTQKVLLSQNMIDVETSSSQYGSNVATKSVTLCDDATLSTQKVLFSQNMIDVETSSSKYGSNVATKSVTSYDDATLSTQKVLFSQIMIDVLTSSSQYGNNVATKSFTSYNDATLSTQKVLFSQNMIDVKSSSSWYGNNVATKSFTSYNDATSSTQKVLFSQNMIDVKSSSSWYGNNVAAETQHNDANFLTTSKSGPEAYSDDSVAPEFKITAISHLEINPSDISRSPVVWRTPSLQSIPVKTPSMSTRNTESIAPLSAMEEHSMITGRSRDVMEGVIFMDSIRHFGRTSRNFNEQTSSSEQSMQKKCTSLQVQERLSSQITTPFRTPSSQYKSNFPITTPNAASENVLSSLSTRYTGSSSVSPKVYAINTETLATVMEIITSPAEGSRSVDSRYLSTPLLSAEDEISFKFALKSSEMGAEHIIPPSELKRQSITVSKIKPTTPLHWSFQATSSERHLSSSSVVHSITPTESFVMNMSTVQASPDVLHGTYDEWTPWSDCSRKCARGSMNRQRNCVFTQQTSNSSNDVCSIGEFVKKECVGVCHGTGFYLADPGMSCRSFCEHKTLLCSYDLEVANGNIAFRKVLLDYTLDDVDMYWFHEYAPYCVNGLCSEFLSIPEIISCESKPPLKAQRLCRCVTEADFGYGPWSSWSQCSSTCMGYKKRYRTCYDFCTGKSEQTRRCNRRPCPIHGEFSEWTAWSKCDKSCNFGTSRRSRKCDNPVPAYGGLDCYGSSFQTKECNPQYCPVDAEVGEWTIWSACDQPCNDGWMIRTRECVKGIYGGVRECTEKLKEFKRCFNNPCPEARVNFNITIDAVYQPELSNTNSESFRILEKNIQNQVLSMYDEQFQDSIEAVILLSARKGSIVTNFTIIYKSLDSYQLVFLQDSIEKEESVGKLPLIEGKSHFYIESNVPQYAPTGIKLKSTSPTSIQLSWNEVDNAVAYVVCFRKRLQLSEPYQRYAAATSPAIISNLEPRTEYVFRILAYNHKGNGFPSEQIAFSTQGKAPDQAPTNLHIHNLNSTSLFLEWDRLYKNEIPISGYKIVYYDYNVNLWIDKTEDHYVYISDLTPGFTYEFEVCAYNDAGDGPSERILTTIVEKPIVKVELAECNTHNTITVKWKPPTGKQSVDDILGYLIEYYKVEDEQLRTEERYEHQFLLHPQIAEQVLPNLNPNTDYQIDFNIVQDHLVFLEKTLTARTCRCPPVVSINYYIVKPYVYLEDNELRGIFAELLDEMIDFACGECPCKLNVTMTSIDKDRDGRGSPAQKSTLDKVIREIDQFTDLSFPIVGQKTLKNYLENEYVPLVDHPGVVFITKDKSVNEAVVSMLMVMSNVIPLIALNMLFMVVVGMLMWFIEGYHQNGHTDFSERIIKGLQDSIYWAFITQGTHGYGDYVPRHFRSRLLAMVWIIIGLVLTALVTGAIVSAISSVEYSSQKNIYDTHIGALNGSFEEMFGILRNGKVNRKAVYTSTSQLADALIDGEIDGILVDAYTAGSNREDFQRPNLRPTKMLKYPRTYGFVVSGDLKNVANAMRDFIRINEKRILDSLSMNTHLMEPVSLNEPTSVFNPTSSVFKSAIIALSSMLMFASCVGMVYTCCKRSRRRKVAADAKALKRLQKTENLKDILQTFASSFQNNCKELARKHDLQRIKLYRAILSGERVNTMGTRPNTSTRNAWFVPEGKEEEKRFDGRGEDNPSFSGMEVKKCQQALPNTQNDFEEMTVKTKFGDVTCYDLSPQPTTLVTAEGEETRQDNKTKCTGDKQKGNLSCSKKKQDYKKLIPWY